MARKILVMGLPGAGKTTLAKMVAPRRTPSISTRMMSVARSTRIWDSLPPIASNKRAEWAGYAIKSSRLAASPSRTSYAPPRKPVLPSKRAAALSLSG